MAEFGCLLIVDVSGRTSYAPPDIAQCKCLLYMYVIRTALYGYSSEK